MEEFKITQLQCNRCNHRWIPRLSPLQCPRCHSYFWNEDVGFDRRKKEFKEQKFKLKPEVVLELNNLKGGKS